MKRVLLTAAMLATITAAQAAEPARDSYPLADMLVVPIGLAYKKACEASGDTWEQVPGRLVWQCQNDGGRHMEMDVEVSKEDPHGKVHLILWVGRYKVSVDGAVIQEQDK